MAARASFERGMPPLLNDPVLQNVLSKRDYDVFFVLDAMRAGFPVVHASDEFCSQMCYASSEIVGKAFDFMAGPDTNPDIMEDMRLALCDGREFSAKFLHYDGNGYPFLNTLTVNPVRVAFGEIKYFIIVLRDFDATRTEVGTARQLTAYQMWRRKSCFSFMRMVPQMVKSKFRRTFRTGVRTSAVEPMASSSNLARVLSMGEADYADALGGAPTAPQQPSLIIGHNSTFKILWDWLVLLMVVYTSVTVPFQAAFDRSVSESMSIFSDAVFWMDIVVNFRTTIVIDGKVVSDWRVIGRVYLRGWFFVDFISSVPFESILSSAQGNGELFQLLKSLRLLRLGKVVRKLDRLGSSGAFQIFYLMLGFALLDHWLACGWYAVGANVNDARTWLKLLPSGDKTSDYVNSIYFTTYTMTTVGYGNIAPSTEQEKIYSVVIMFIGAVAYASIFGNMASIIQRAYLSSSKYQATILSMKEFIRFHRIPATLQRRILSYAQHSWEMTHGIDMNAMLDSFPEALRADVSMHLHQPLVANSPLFKNASKGCMRSIALKLRTTFSAPGDCLIHQGDAIDTLFFIARGSMEIVVNERRVAVLSDGDFFGEMSLGEKSLGKANATVRALTFCDLHNIMHIDLLDIMHRYPEFMPEFKKNLHYSYSLRAKRSQNKEKELAAAADAVSAAVRASVVSGARAAREDDGGGSVHQVDVELGPLGETSRAASAVKLRKDTSWNGSTVDFFHRNGDEDIEIDGDSSDGDTDYNSAGLSRGGQSASQTLRPAANADESGAGGIYADAEGDVAAPMPVGNSILRRPPLPPHMRRISMGSAPNLGAAVHAEQEMPTINLGSGNFELRPPFVGLNAPSSPQIGSGRGTSSRGLFIRKPIVQHNLESGILSRMDAHEKKMQKYLEDNDERVQRMEAAMSKLSNDVNTLIGLLRRRGDDGNASMGRPSMATSRTGVSTIGGGVSEMSEDRT